MKVRVKDILGSQGKEARGYVVLIIEAARGEERSKGTYLNAQLRRLSARRGKKKAAIAVGHTILVIVYHILSCRQIHHKLGANYFDGREKHSLEKRLVGTLSPTGYQVVLEPVATGVLIAFSGEFVEILPCLDA